jgi:hypothetical protein
MSEPSELVTARDLEAMTAAQRAATLRDALVTDLDSLDDHTAAVVNRGGDKIRSRLQNQG